MCIRDSNESSSAETEEISLLKPLRGPVRIWCQQPPISSYTSWVNYPPGSETMAAPERDYWTSLFEIPTP